MELKILRKVRSGGFGDIWEAQDDLGRRLAVKTFQPSMASAGDLRAHAMALAKINHSNVVIIHSVEMVALSGATDPVEAIVMEYLEGDTLTKVFKGNTWTTAEVRAHGLALLDGLSAIHKAGISHGDLHSDNVMVSDGRLKILDIYSTASYLALTTGSVESRQHADVCSARSLLHQLLSLPAFSVAAAAHFAETARSETTLDGLRTIFIDAVESDAARAEPAKGAPVPAGIKPSTSQQAAFAEFCQKRDTADVQWSCGGIAGAITSYKEALQIANAHQLQETMYSQHVAQARIKLWIAQLEAAVEPGSRQDWQEATAAVPDDEGFRTLTNGVDYSPERLRFGLFLRAVAEWIYVGDDEEAAYKKATEHFAITTSDHFVSSKDLRDRARNLWSWRVEFLGPAGRNGDEDYPASFRIVGPGKKQRTVVIALTGHLVAALGIHNRRPPESAVFQWYKELLRKEAPQRWIPDRRIITTKELDAVREPLLALAKDRESALTREDILSGLLKVLQSHADIVGNVQISETKLHEEILRSCPAAEGELLPGDIRPLVFILRDRRLIELKYAEHDFIAISIRG